MKKPSPTPVLPVKKKLSNWKKALFVFLAFGAVAITPMVSDLYEHYVKDRYLITREEVIDNAQNGVIIVAAKDIVDLQSNEPQPNSLGTGFIIGENILLTNNHVVNEAKEVVIDTATNNGPPYDAIVKYNDKSLDIAVLEVKDWEKFKTENPIQILPIQENHNLVQVVYTIGHAWGLYYSISHGVISYEHRKIPDDNSPRYFIQTDANIFQGNSGGPMLNDEGEVLGMNTMIIANTGGSYGFAVPSILINKALKDFEKYGEIRWAIIGIEMENGTVIRNVVKGGAADLAGLQVGDKILGISVDGDYTTVQNSIDVAKIFAKSDYGSSFAITIMDTDGEQITLDIIPTYKTAKDLET
jgi:S1-C subfamily serine protease